ncbi:MAG TPA: hypothetical protein PLO89_01340, partial [Spirochaetota bacterium]|nr:hypothetical protein [Spirochaetota bacterium]
YGEKYFTKIDYGYKKTLEADEYEGDDAFQSSKYIKLGKANFQSRSIFPSADEDYIKFQAEKGKTYSFETFFEDSEIDNASVTLLNESGTILDSSGIKNSVSGLFKIRNWYSDIDRTLYLKVKLSNSFIGNYKTRVIYYKDDKNINDF